MRAMKSRRKVEQSTRPGQILDAAEAYFGAGEYAVAIINAHTACEVAIRERLELEAGPRKNAPATDTGGQSPFSPKGISTAIGLDIEAEPFWKIISKSAEKRNGIVHRGETATVAEARQAINAAKAVIKFVEGAANENIVVPGNHDVTGEFVKQLRSLLESRGLNQKELAKRSKVSRPVISRLLSGRHSPNLRTIARIADALGCKADIRLIDRQSG
jgi:ribosome-binding protein aMBF1 (putative translation factor)